ncbi:MAG: hypothetical protein NTU89_02145 [Candidatus Dependentiae bacterium]|nr:hypothetical protein [Candidatus Dependentiae bacterium]
MKKSMFLLFVFHVGTIFAKSSLIILYGGSSAGKSSVSRELCKALPGKWKVVGIDMFDFSQSRGVSPTNLAMWRQISKDIDSGYNVIVDTISPQFVFDKSKAQEFVVITYCPPVALIDHVAKRNKGTNDRDHRKVKSVLAMYYNKFRTTLSEKESIDVLRKSDLENATSNKRALNKIKKDFFSGNRTKVFIASVLSQYDCCVNTGKMSVISCVRKIQQGFDAHIEKQSLVEKS